MAKAIGKSGKSNLQIAYKMSQSYVLRRSPRKNFFFRHTLLPFHPSTKGRNHALRRYRRAIRREEGALDDKYSLMDGYSACREIIPSGPFVAVSSATNPNSVS